jgi:hypothetical protein
MRLKTSISRGTLALYAVVNAVFSIVVSITAIWAGAPLAAIPWVIYSIISASIAIYASMSGWATARRLPLTMLTRTARMDVRPVASDPGQRRRAA